jgi:hypothetical protein
MNHSIIDAVLSRTDKVVKETRLEVNFMLAGADSNIRHLYPGLLGYDTVQARSSTLT